MSSESSNVVTPPTPTSLQADGSSPFGADDNLAHQYRSYAAPEEWKEEDYKSITQPYEYIAARAGKGIRNDLLHAFNEILNVPLEQLNVIGTSIKILHNASLIIDDIQDNSSLRRGGPSAHVVYGVARTINAANYAYFLAQQQLYRLTSWPAALRVFNGEILRLHCGQGMELFWRDSQSLLIPSERQYLQMASDKTGGLFRLAVSLMMTVAGVDEVDRIHSLLLELAENVGVLYQIQDDYQDLTSAKMHKAKGCFAADITEGKLTFPILHALRHSPSPTNDELWHILRLRTESEDLKRRAIAYMGPEGTNSLEYTQKAIGEWHQRAKLLMYKLGPGSTMMRDIIDRMVETDRPLAGS